MGASAIGADYFDLEAILAEEERVPVLFLTSVTGVGRALDPSCDDDDLAEGVKVDLPQWLTKGQLSEKRFVEVRTPKCFNERVKKDIQADPGVVNLRERSAFFYAFGRSLCRILDNNAELADFLLITFRGRYKDLLLQSHFAPDEDVQALKRIMTREEIRIFEAGRQSMQSFTQWRQRKDSIYNMAPILGKKRKR
ncbi:hypothetical protein KFL_000090080 [Klebsormidium nitens]|uniref:Uncharacterized protein n=1 Tax=Klebsormidium nitens TaxID=105231 RepID=A0A1Y1HKK9_KLENI|nr:hypothetical protein KFL_000090080 [Klebsormidium nitens]|eukprot:GAQ78162.1 hypothetical protein KFL_000090080 [Klebsormidium nitens]